MYKKNFFSLALLLQLTMASIYYDTGEYSGFNSNACNAGASQTKTVTFSGTFQSIPQVAYHLAIFSLQFSGSVQDSQVKSEILSITTTNFQVKVSCPLTSGLSSRYAFQWYATCVPRITIIRSDIIANPQNGEVYPHSHSNSLATQGFVMFADLEYKGTFEFYLDIQSVSTNDVKVKFTSNNNNALSIGYFVIIGPANSFDKSTLRKTPSGTTTVYQSASITFASVGSLFIPSPGFAAGDTHKYKHNIKFQKKS